jgi:hypothetical protein
MSVRAANDANFSNTQHIGSPLCEGLEWTAAEYRKRCVAGQERDFQILEVLFFSVIGMIPASKPFI